MLGTKFLKAIEQPMMDSKVFFKEIKNKLEVLLIKTGVNFWIKLSFAHFHRFFIILIFSCFYLLANACRNHLSAIICVAEGIGNYIVALLLQQTISKVMIHKIEDGLSSYDSSEKAFNVLMKVNDSVIIVHGFWNAMAVGGKVIGELPQKTLAG